MPSYALEPVFEDVDAELDDESIGFLDDARDIQYGAADAWSVGSDESDTVYVPPTMRKDVGQPYLRSAPRRPAGPPVPYTDAQLRQLKELKMPLPRPRAPEAPGQHSGRAASGRRPLSRPGKAGVVAPNVIAAYSVPAKPPAARPCSAPSLRDRYDVRPKQGSRPGPGQGSHPQAPPSAPPRRTADLSVATLLLREKESLAEEVVALRRQVRPLEESAKRLAGDNTRLQQAVVMMERHCAERDRELLLARSDHQEGGLSAYLKGRAAPGTGVIVNSVTLVSALKRRVRELRATVQALADEIRTLRASTRAQRVWELEKEVRRLQALLLGRSPDETLAATLGEDADLLMSRHSELLSSVPVCTALELLASRPGAARKRIGRGEGLESALQASLRGETLSSTQVAAMCSDAGAAVGDGRLGDSAREHEGLTSSTGAPRRRTHGGKGKSGAPPAAHSTADIVRFGTPRGAADDAAAAMAEAAAAVSSGRAPGVGDVFAEKALLMQERIATEGELGRLRRAAAALETQRAEALREAAEARGRAKESDRTAAEAVALADTLRAEVSAASSAASRRPAAAPQQQQTQPQQQQLVSQRDAVSDLPPALRELTAHAVILSQQHSVAAAAFAAERHRSSAALLDANAAMSLGALSGPQPPSGPQPVSSRPSEVRKALAKLHRELDIAAAEALEQPPPPPLPSEQPAARPSPDYSVPPAYADRPAETDESPASGQERQPEPAPADVGAWPGDIDEGAGQHDAATEEPGSASGGWGEPSGRDVTLGEDRSAPEPAQLRPQPGGWGESSQAPDPFSARDGWGGGGEGERGACSSSTNSQQQPAPVRAASPPQAAEATEPMPPPEENHSVTSRPAAPLEEVGPPEGSSTPEPEPPRQQLEAAPPPEQHAPSQPQNALPPPPSAAPLPPIAALAAASRPAAGAPAVLPPPLSASSRQQSQQQNPLFFDEEDAYDTESDVGLNDAGGEDNSEHGESGGAEAASAKEKEDKGERERAPGVGEGLEGEKQQWRSNALASPAGSIDSFEAEDF